MTWRTLSLWGGTPVPQPTPSSAIRISLKLRQAGRGRPARVRGPVPRSGPPAQMAGAEDEFERARR